MLTDPEDIRLAASAQEPGIRRPDRSPRGPEEILRDFFPGVELGGKRILELGPGHYEFCDAVRSRGATAEAIELDPPVAEIGRRHGHVVHQHDLRRLDSFSPAAPYDGLFGKGSNNPFWVYPDETALEAYILKLRSLVRPGGWIWIVSCPYTALELAPPAFDAWLDLERRLYLRHGFRAWTVTDSIQGGFYGISVPCQNLDVFTLGLPPWRRSLRSRLHLAAFAARRRAAALTRSLLHR
jgi:hypothetical protein